MFGIARPICRRHSRVYPIKGTLSELNTGEPVFYIKHHMDGEKEAKYHVNFIDLLDRVFTKDGLRFLSIEQEQFMKLFFKEAGIVTDRLNDEGYTGAIYDNIDSAFQQLDDFLGSYEGVDYGRYSRQC